MKSFISRSFGSQLNVYGNSPNHSRLIDTPIEQGIDCHALLIPNDSTPTNGISQENLLLPPDSFFVPRLNGGGDSWSQSPSVTFSYAQEWYRFFGSKHCDKNSHDSNQGEGTRLQQYAITGRLRNSRFRSICWRIFLGVLSPDNCKWLDELAKQRQHFARINSQWNQNPANQISGDHPLASDLSSSWNQYFRSLQIKRQIVQDVERTFPNVEYFRKPQVRDIMINILYCYSVHTTIPYRQGMHEVLAPLLFVLHCDLTAFAHAQESGLVPSDLLKQLLVILDPDHFEADCFTMFTWIMNAIHKWYYPNADNSQLSSSGDCLPNGLSFELPCTSVDPILFYPPNDDTRCPGVTFAESIHKTILAKYDYDLYLHLKRLEIAPAFFGVRWIRLLFGYEFPLQDLVYIWDCIFAIGDHYAFVPFMYVSMLLYLSPMLMNRGYSECLSLLMRFPTGVDVTSLIYTALHLYRPKVYTAPVHLANKQQLRSQKPGAAAAAAQIKISKSQLNASLYRNPKNLPTLDTPTNTKHAKRARSLSRRTSTVSETSRKPGRDSRVISGSANTLNRTSFFKEIFNYGPKSFSAQDSSPVTELPLDKSLYGHKPVSQLQLPNESVCDPITRTEIQLRDVKRFVYSVRSLIKVCLNSLNECSDTLALMLNQTSHSSVRLPIDTLTMPNGLSVQSQLIQLLQNKLKSARHHMIDFVRDDLCEMENQLSSQTDYEPDQSLLELVDSLVTFDLEDKPMNLSSWSTMYHNDVDILGPPGAMLPMGPMQ